MPIRVPKNSAYYYEATARGTKLLLWLHKDHLAQLVKDRNVSENILRDYPDGIDIEVSVETFKDLNKRYGINIDISPGDIWRAFNAIWLKGPKKRLPCSGYIDRAFMDNLAHSIHEDLIQYKDLKTPLAMPKGKRGLKMRNQLNRRRRAYLKEFPIEGMDLQKPLDTQEFSHVKMLPGEEPFDFFRRLQKKKRGEK